MHRKVAAALVAALALGVASCGESGRTLTRAELVRQVEAACRQGQQETQQKARASGRSESTATFLAAILAGQRVIVARIKDLNGAGEAKSEFADFKQGVQQRLDLFQRVQSAGSAGVLRAIRAVQAETEAITRRVHDAATRLGIEGCT